MLWATEPTSVGSELVICSTALAASLSHVIPTDVRVTSVCGCAADCVIGLCMTSCSDKIFITEGVEGWGSKDVASVAATLSVGAIFVVATKCTLSGCCT
uniref:Putative secreted protein n=1 Tax=Ixodes ricinus TaxID=34613 RepID=A0A6B0U5D6_IXORI